jgi:hypothetical protein
MRGKLVLRFDEMWDNADNWMPGTVEYSDFATIIFRKQGEETTVEFTEAEWEEIVEFIQKEIEKDAGDD